jgi:hypothetical protein
MEKMTKTQIQERQLAILGQLDEMETRSREANGGEIKFTDEEAAKYDTLVRESAGLSAKAKAMASSEELKNIRSNEEKGKQLREMLKKCVEKRENATTVLANAVTTGADQNVNGNLEAGGLIPTTIAEIIDTKVAGLELPADLKQATGVTGNEIVPYSTNDVKFTVNGEVQKIGSQKLTFDKLQANPQRVAASVAVSHRAIDNAAFDIVAFITFKLQKGWAMFKALHVYAHGNYAKMQGPFAGLTAEEVTLDENIGKNLALKAAAIEDAIPDGATTFIMDKVTETNLAFTKLLAGQGGDKTVIEGGKIAQTYAYIVSPFINYTINASGEASKENDRYIGIGKFSYEAMQQHGEFRFNIDAASEAAFNAGTVFVGVSTDFSLTELSAKVNGTGAVQAFKLIKLIEPASSNEIGG